MTLTSPSADANVLADASPQRKILARGYFCNLLLLITERVEGLRQEIAEILEANRPLPRRSKHRFARADHERRLERLREIMGELASLTDWKKV